MDSFKNYSRKLLAFLALAATTLSLSAQIQNQTIKIVQSPYYDALGLYYALQGIPAYPIELTSSDFTQVIKVWPALPVPQPKKIYKIVETNTGKLLMDRVGDYELSSTLAAIKADDSIIGAIIDSILCRNGGLAQAAAWNTILNAYADNSYLMPFLQQGNKQLANPAGLNLYLDVLMGPTNPSGKGGGVSSSVLLEGLADFYIAQVNAEINDAFFVHLQKVLDDYPEIKTLFPESVATLAKIDVIRYQTILNTLKVAFEKDIRQILGNFPKLAALKHYSDVINKYPELTTIFAGCDLAYQIQQRYIPAEILQRMYIAPYVSQTKPNLYRAAIQMAGVTSYSFRDIHIGDVGKESKAWVSTSQIDLFRNNAALFQIFMGLYAQNARDIIFTLSGREVNYRSVLITKQVDILKAKYLIYNFSQDQKKIGDAFVAIQGDGLTEKEKFSYAMDIAEQLLALTQTAADILPTANSADFRDIANKLHENFLPFIKQSSELVADIQAKEYGRAVFKADTLLGKIFDYWQQYNTALKGLDKDVKTITEKQAHVRENFRKYGLFVASVAEAKTPSDVKDAIRAFALPKGSSRIKKETTSSFGINSYVGIYHAWNKDYAAAQIPDKETGLTAPIGFSYNRGHFLGGSLTAYAGVLDIGAIFSYKLTSDNNLKSDIQLGQVFSPSLGLIYGLPILNKYNIPLSLGANMQWGPRLKSVSDAGNSVLPLMTRRFNIFIAFDIPIINFFTSK